MTWREEQIGDCRLILGDCLEVLPLLSNIDVLLTDPVWPNCPPGLLHGAGDPDKLFADFCQIMPLVRQAVICLRNDCDPRFLRHIPRRLRFQQVAWCQYVMPGFLGRVLGGNECAYVFGDAIQSNPGRRVVPSVSPKAQPSDRPPNGHPCSRALVHQEWLVNWFSDEKEIVLDPFMGSGTTGIACIKLDRSFVGIEIDLNYFDLSCRRLEKAQAESGDIFRPEKVQALAGDIFDGAIS